MIRFLHLIWCHLFPLTIDPNTPSYTVKEIINP